MSRSRVVSTVRGLASLCLLVAAGCGVYTFSGGGGLPGHIDSIAILPFDNRTTQFTLTQELTQELQDEVPGRLGLRAADEASANAVLRGEIIRYDERAVNYQEREGGPIIFQRRVDITISAEIYDVVEDQVIWSSRALTASGEYLPDSQNELVGRQIALENIVQLIIDGAQSQW
jgi:hypothetical protein